MADLSQYDDIFQAAGNEWNVDPTLLKAVASVESSGRTNAVSSKNAQGLMQIIPETQKYLGVTDPTDPVQSIYGAAKYLSEGLDKEGTPEGALLYYHGGPQWRQAYGPESRAYVPAVTAQYVALKPQQPDQPQTAQPAAAPQGPVIVGDSLASKGGLGGSGVIGANPGAVRAAIGAGNQTNAYQGRDVVLSSGASNAPGDMTNVEGQLQNLKNGNVASVTLLGVGPGIEAKNPGTNAALAALADKYGARFQPLPSDQMGPDGVHPTGKGYRTLLAAVTPKTATDATPASAPAPAAPQGQGKAMASDDLPSWLPPAPSAGGGANATADGLPSWLPPAPQSTAKAAPAQPTPSVDEYGRVITPLASAPTASLDESVRTALAPAPNTVYGDVLPLAMDTQTGQMRPAMPNMLRAPLLGLTGGVGNAITISPDTGKLGLTPEAASTAAFAATPLRFSGPNALMREPPGTLTRPPPVTMEELNAAIARADQQPPRTGQPSDGAPTSPPGGPQSVGAAATPPRLVNITPEEETAYRTTQEGNKLLENQQPGIPDRNVYVTGVTPNLVEQEQTVNAAREMKQLGIESPEASQDAKLAANANNEARRQYWNDTRGSDVDAMRERVQRETDINNDKQTVFAPGNVKGDVDMTPAVKSIDDALSKPENRQNTALQSVLGDLRKRLVGADGNPVTMDPREAWGLRQDIDRLTDKRMQANDPNLHYVAHDLSGVSDVIDGQIDKMAPGYKDMLATYQKHSQNLAAMQVLKDAEINGGLFRGPNMQMNYNDFQRFMKNVVDARSTPSTDLNPYKSISDETMQRLWNLRDDLRRSAGALELARAPGSDTVPNIIDALKRYGTPLAIHGVANYISPGWGSIVVRGLQEATASYRAARAEAATRERMRQMLYPKQGNALNQAQP